jgi:hypothetical protein
MVKVYLFYDLLKKYKASVISFLTRWVEEDIYVRITLII